jgi:predicted ATPase
MIKRVKIKNFKSIKDMDVEVGRFNLIIGENGAGKSNFAEALTVFGIAEENKMDKTLLKNRGVRVLQGRSLVSKFGDSNKSKISLMETDQTNYPEDFESEVQLHETDESYSNVISNHKGIKAYWWSYLLNKAVRKIVEEQGIDAIDRYVSLLVKPDSEQAMDLERQMQEKISLSQSNNIAKNFVIYSPEYSILREEVVRDVVVEPLGIKGDGLLKLLSYMKANEQDAFKDVLECASMFSWVDSIEVCDIEQISGDSDSKITIIDKYVNEKIFYKIANEGLLFVLFYAAVFCSKQTPKAFAIDNIDASLNPKMCRVLTEKLISLAKKYNKQVFVTTHNPAVLDGLNLHDDDQRLFIAERNDLGHTLLERVTVDDLPKPTRSGQTISLGEAFMRGHLGALPKNF